MADQYRVDLSALDNVIKKLNGLLKDLGSANSDARYKTLLSQTALGADANGVNFLEANGLTSAHEMMKRHIEEVVDHLNMVMDEFGKKTKKAHDAYQSQEDDVMQDMAGGA